MLKASPAVLAIASSWGKDVAQAAPPARVDVPLLDCPRKEVYRVVPYRNEQDVACFSRLYVQGLSERYTTNMFRYFIQSPELTFLIEHIETNEMVAAITGCKKAPSTMPMEKIGYIGMLSVDPAHRRNGLARILVNQVLLAFEALQVTTVRVDTEWDNAGSLGLYEQAGFTRKGYMARFYLNGAHAYRLEMKLPVKPNR